ncbi:polysaccharide deacetylase family protein [Polaribacter pectinis]|uniref:Polysaccharide deacetylase family protein n=1 Tax=Polaribacter pectinis TaxID=2738844 RepID=A0A7G9LCB9_9FLAO|nr:polysaccharide deacetylase family protein [Polaribacter pectinis]QNM86268.1 polysaccharide deacetylase family protein [Polaribacter pectinis]
MLTIVNYHYIRESFNTKYPSIFGMTNVQFKKQLLLLKNQGDFLSINEFNNNYQDIIASKDNFNLITFDDGLKEQYINAYSILKELDLEAYFFLNALNFKEKKVSLVHKIHLLKSILEPKLFLEKLKKELKYTFSKSDTERSCKIYRFDTIVNAELKYLLNFLFPNDSKATIINKLFDNYFDEKEVNSSLYMAESEVLELSEKNMIGNHTYSHKHLGVLNKDELNKEIVESKKYLEKVTKSVINTISYPYGTEEVINENVLETATESYHKFGFTTEKGINDSNQNLLLLKRFDCNDLIGGKSYEG